MNQREARPPQFRAEPAPADGALNHERVRGLLQEAVSAPPEDTIDLDAAIRHGRTLRRRTRIRRIVTAAVATAAVTVLAVAVLAHVLIPDAAQRYVRPASVPRYTGPAFLPLSQWQQAVARLLPGRVVTSYPVSSFTDTTGIEADYRLERGGRTSVIRVNVWSGGGGNNGYCSLGMRQCTRLVPAPEVPGARMQAFNLDQTHAHEDGRAASLLRGVHRLPQVGYAPQNLRAAVELQVTAVAGDVGPGPDGYTVGMVIPAQPALTTDELLALAQTLPLPLGVQSFLNQQP